MEGTKACSKCGEVKALSQFVRSKKAKDGREAHCLACERARKNTPKSYQRDCERLRSNPWSAQLSKMVTSSRQRAKEKELEHNIDVKYLRTIATSHCPYLGVELHWQVQRGLGVSNRVFPNSPSLDRIDSSKGYVKGNVAIVSHRANSIKRDATEVELIEMGRRIAELKMRLIVDEE